MFSPSVRGTASLTPQLEIQINGTALDRSSSTARADLLRTQVREDVDAPGMFALTLINRDLTSGNITWSDHNLFDVGNAVKIKMGDGTTLQTLVTGEITGLEPEFQQEEIPIVVVREYDLRHRMMRGQQTRTFVKMKDSEIASQIARESGLKAKVQDTKVKFEYVLQHNQTDLDFLQSRAQRIGYEVAIEGKTLLFQPHRNDTDRELTLTYGENLLSFSPRLSTMNQTARVEVRGWNMQEKQATVGQANAAEVRSVMGKTSGPKISQNAFGAASHVLVTEPVSNTSESQGIARGQLETRALDYITGSGECWGNPRLRAGMVIEMAGLGKRFSGLYYVVSATHTYAPEEGYHTEFEVRRNAT